jgi:hypothetical protein
MKALLAIRRTARLDTDVLAQWLDEVGMPVMLAVAMVTIAASLAA